jgi:hypothetical protein
MDHLHQRAEGVQRRDGALRRSAAPYGEIFAMRADGSDVRQLTDNKWEDASAGWIPESKAKEGTSEAARK